MGENKKINWGAVIIQLIIGLTTIAVAWIQAGNAFTSADNAEQSKIEALDASKQAVAATDISKVVPIGTVISSPFDFERFSELTENFSGGNFDDRTSIWAPADGRNVDDSRYARTFGFETVPDLRGQFVRGRNQFYSTGAPSEILNGNDPDGNIRSPKNGISYQKESIKVPESFSLNIYDKSLSEFKTEFLSERHERFEHGYDIFNFPIEEYSGVLKTGSYNGGNVYGISFKRNIDTLTYNGFYGMVTKSGQKMWLCISI